MATPARNVKLVYQPPMTPVKTPTVEGLVTPEDIATNVVIIADDTTSRLQLGQAIAATMLGKRPVVILTSNNSFGNLNVARGKNIIQDIATDQVNGTFQLLAEDGETIAQKIAAGESFKIDVATLSQEQLSTFLNMFGRELNRLNVCDALFVLDIAELFLPRKRNGYDTSGIADFHQLLTTARMRGNNFISMVESADDMIIEVRNKTKTFIVGRLGSEAHIRSLNGAIGDQRLFRYRNESQFNIGVRTMSSDSFWLFNMATSNVRPGMPFYINPNFFTGQVPGNPTRRGNQDNQTSKKLIKDLQKARDEREEERRAEAERKLADRNRQRETSAKLNSRGRQRDLQVAARSRKAKPYSFVLMRKTGVSKEAKAILTREGITPAFELIAVATQVLNQNRKPVTVESVVNFIRGNDVLNNSTRLAISLQRRFPGVLTVKMLGAFHYQMARKNKASADNFINTLWDKDAVGAVAETKTMLVNATAVTGKKATRTHYRILNAGWNRFLIEESAKASAANDNSETKNAA